MVAWGIVGLVFLSVFGGLFYVVVNASREAERNKVISEIEHDTAEKLRTANEIIATHSDPDDLERELRDGSF